MAEMAYSFFTQPKEVVMFKKFILAAILTFIFSVPAMAAGIGRSSDYAMKDNINVISRSSNMNGSAGVFIGTIGEVKLDTGKQLIGLGGASFHVGDTGSLVFTAVPLTLFD